MKKMVWSMLLVLVVLAAVVPAMAGCDASAAAATPEHSKPEEQHEHGIPELPPVFLPEGEKLKVVATTSIVADVVKNIGGDRILFTVLMPLDADPHTFEPTPQEVAQVSDAHVLFANGAGLEEFLTPLLASAGVDKKTVNVSEEIELLQPEAEHKGANEHKNEEGDPHTWTDPTNVKVWVRNIKDALKDLDPDNAEVYEANAKVYDEKLEELDAWVREQVALIPEANRQIITDHQLFAYFADEYGFTQVGAIVPAYSTMAEPSAKELAELEDAIKDMRVRAVFVGNTVNPSLAQRVAKDTGVKLVFIYTGSLTEPGGDADNYLDYIRYNVEAIVNALK